MQNDNKTKLSCLPVSLYPEVYSGKLSVTEWSQKAKNIGLDYIDINAKEDICCCKVSKAVIEHQTTVIKSGGDSQVFIGKFYDKNGDEVVDIVPHWTIICDFSNKLQVKEFDNCLSIGIDDDSHIDDEFKLICSDGNDKSEILSDALIIKIDSLL